MARPEITSRKVEETTTVESKKKGKGKTTRKRHPLPPRREGDAYTISEFCAANRISASMYHKLKSLGLGPREMDVGRRKNVEQLPLDSPDWMPVAEALRLLQGFLGNPYLAAKDLFAAAADKRSDKRLPCMRRAMSHRTGSGPGNCPALVLG